VGFTETDSVRKNELYPSLSYNNRDRPTVGTYPSPGRNGMDGVVGNMFCFPQKWFAEPDHLINESDDHLINESLPNLGNF